jgi:hypothetical protein
LFTFREAGAQVSPVNNVMPSPKNLTLPCLSLGIKDSLKEDARLLLWGFLLKPFAFGFLMGKAFLMWEAFGKEKNC